MANTTITNLPTVTSLNGTEPLLGVQSSSSVQITTGQIATYAGTTFGLQPISPTYMLANITGSSAIASGVSITQYLDNAVTSVQGSIMYRSASLWTALAPGILGQALTTNGPNANPQYRDFSGGGTVLSITAGTNLSATPANPITSSGTISTVMNPTFTTSVTTPSIYGGSSVSQTLLLQSTTGVGTSDSIAFKVGNNGATTAMTILSGGNVGIGTTNPLVKLAINSTDSILSPVGTTGQRPTAATGYFRFNTSLPRFEGYDGTSWTPFAITTGAGNDTIFTLNGQTVTTNYTVPATTNAMSSGPIVVNTSIIVTVTTGSQWNII